MNLNCYLLLHCASLRFLLKSGAPVAYCKTPDVLIPKHEYKVKFLVKSRGFCIINARHSFHVPLLYCGRRLSHCAARTAARLFS